MAQRQNFGVGSCLILVMLMSILFLTGCSRFQPEPEIKVITKTEKITVPIVARPKPLQLNDTQVRVVNKDNLELFLTEFEEQYGSIAFVVLSMRDYQALALNIADIRRYVNQQTQIIVYYEDALKVEEPEPIDILEEKK